MKIAKKLRDVTPEEFEKWIQTGCKLTGRCKDCIFAGVDCCGSYEDNWAYYKDKYSDKFLDQTIEVEVDDVLEREKHKYHVYYVMKGDMYIFANSEEEAEEIVNHKKFDDLTEHLNSGCDITETSQVEEGEENEY